MLPIDNDLLYSQYLEVTQLHHWLRSSNHHCTEFGLGFPSVLFMLQVLVTSPPPSRLPRVECVQHGSGSGVGRARSWNPLPELYGSELIRCFTRPRLTLRYTENNEQRSNGL
jgi:hypothetical protein